MMIRFLAMPFGLLMVAAAGVASHGPAFVAAMLAVAAVLAGMVFRPAATLAVLLTVAAIVLADQSPLLVGLSGLCATAYLVLRHASTAFHTVSWPTTVAAVGFTLAGLVATVFPFQLPWLPLLAPLTVLGIYLLATRPFVGE